MRRYIGVLAIVVLLVTAIGGSHASAEPAARVEKLTYSSNPDECCFGNTNLGAGMIRLALPPGPERFLSLEVADAASPEVAFSVSQGQTYLAWGCTSTQSPIPIYPGGPVTVELHNGRCPDGRPSAVTTGELTATFERQSSAAQKQMAQYSPYMNIVGIKTQPPGILVGEVEFPPGLGNRVSIEIADQSGAAIWAEVIQDEVVANICGSTPKPLRINPHFPVVVSVNTGQCMGGDLSVATSGTVTATFSGSTK